MRESFRRYQLAETERQLLADPLRASRLAELKQVMAELQQESTARGLDKITSRQLNAEIAGVRKARDSRRRSKSPGK